VIRPATALSLESLTTMLLLTEQTVHSWRTPAGRKIMKRQNEPFPRLLTLALLAAVFANCASAANKGFVIAMGGGNGTPEIYEKWKCLGGGKNAQWSSFRPRITRR
jgi:hypothetical protein